MTAPALLAQAAVAIALVAAGNAAVRRLAAGSVPRTALARADAAGGATHLFLGDSLVQAGFDPAAFAAGHPAAAPVNLGLGATAPVEHLILLERAAAAARPGVVMYGCFDRWLTDPAVAGWADLRGNRALGLIAGTDTLVRHAAAGRPVLAAELRLGAWVPWVVERGTVWAKVERLRRQLAAVGLPPRAANRFGRADDFALLEATDPAGFRTEAAARAAAEVPLSPPVAELAGRVAAAGGRLVVVDMPMPAAHRSRFYAGSEWAAYREHVRGRVAIAGGVWVDATDWAADDEFDDPLHLSAVGARRFSRRLGEHLLAAGL